MTRFQIALRAAVLLLALFAGGAHAQSCTPTAGGGALTVTDIFGAKADAQGSISLNCTRPSGTANRFPSVFWIGISGTNGSRAMTNGANSIGYYLFTNYATCSTAWQGTTGVTVSNSLTGTGDTSTTVTGTFCLEAYSGQTTAKPLAYSGSLTITVRSTNSTGFVWASFTGAGSITVDPRCYFSTGPGTITMNYTSFQATAATGSGSFQMRCTNTTPYSLSLDAATGSVLGLTYGIGLGTVGTTTVGSQTGTGVAQSYTLPASIAAGQPGTCATSAGCSASSTRTVTVTY